MMKKFFSNIKKGNSNSATVSSSRVRRKFAYFYNKRNDGHRGEDKKKRPSYFGVFDKNQQIQAVSKTKFGKKVLKDDYYSNRLVEEDFTLGSEDEEPFTPTSKKTTVLDSSNNELTSSFLSKRKGKRQLRRERKERIRTRSTEAFSAVTNRENSKFSSKKNPLKSLFFSFIKNGNRKELLNSTVPFIFSSFKQKKAAILRGMRRTGRRRRRFQIKKSISSFLKISFSKIFPIVGLTTKRIAGVNRPIPKIFKKKSSRVTPAVAWVKKALGYRKEFPYRYRIFRELESIADSSSYIYKYKQDHYNRVSNNKNFLFSRRKKKRT